MIKTESNAPKSATSIKRGRQFAKPEHFEHGGPHVATIERMSTIETGGEVDSYGNPYTLFFTVAGHSQSYSKGLKPSSPGTISLVAMFGPDEAKWKGKQFVIGVSVKDDSPQLTYSPIERKRAA